MVITQNDTSPVSKINRSLWLAQAEFIDSLMFYGVTELSQSLKLIHDLALYHSDVPFGPAEKSALLNMKMLWESLERVELEC